MMEPSPDGHLELRDVVKHFSVKSGRLGVAPVRLRAVDGVSLSVRRGETLGLVGESGCGKSTLARLILRVYRPSSGDILLSGRSVWCDDAALINEFPRKVQMIFQDPFSSLNPRQKVGSAIAEGLRIHRIGDRASQRARVAELLDQVGLGAEFAGRYPHEFSGGQRQRVAIARALALGPELVVCDEPVSALDVSIQAQVLNLLLDLQERLGLTYLFISHDLSVVSHVSDRVAVMYLGRIVELAAADELYATQLHPYTRALLAAAPRADPNRRLSAPSLRGDIPSPVNPPRGCPFHPRCPQAMPHCANLRPTWTEAAPGRFVACLLHGPGREDA